MTPTTALRGALAASIAALAASIAAFAADVHAPKVLAPLGGVVAQAVPAAAR